MKATAPGKTLSLTFSKFSFRIFIPLSNNVENFLVFKNFLVLKKYNNSDFYALTVGALANKIKLKKWKNFL